MTIMIESSRTFLFTEYARSGCGTFKDQGTDPKVWDALPVSFIILNWHGSALIVAGQIFRIPQHPGDSQESQGGQRGSQGKVRDFLR